MNKTEKREFVERATRLLNEHRVVDVSLGSYRVTIELDNGAEIELYAVPKYDTVEMEGSIFNFPVP